MIRHRAERHHDKDRRKRDQHEKTDQAERRRRRRGERNGRGGWGSRVDDRRAHVVDPIAVVGRSLESGRFEEAAPSIVVRCDLGEDDRPRPHEPLHHEFDRSGSVAHAPPRRCDPHGQARDERLQPDRHEHRTSDRTASGFDDHQDTGAGPRHEGAEKLRPIVVAPTERVEHLLVDRVPQSIGLTATRPPNRRRTVGQLEGSQQAPTPCPAEQSRRHDQRDQRDHCDRVECLAIDSRGAATRADDELGVDRRRR